LLAAQRVLREGGAERVANDNRLPAQMRHGEIERLGEITPGHVRGEQDLRTDRASQERFVDMSGRAGRTLTQEVADQGLLRPLEPQRRVL
jgi:hypothetical protein